MTTTPDPRILGLTRSDRPLDSPAVIARAYEPRPEESGPDESGPRPDPGDLHLLRLALDLQLDAMLLTLGAAAHADGRGETSVTVPWQRWLEEDLELALTLAAVLVDAEGAPLPVLGGGYAHNEVDTSLENLSARYESMENLLTDVLDGPSAGQSWRGPAGETLARCRARIVELHRHRREAIRSTAAEPSTPFLPGEWLG